MIYVNSHEKRTAMKTKKSVWTTDENTMKNVRKLYFALHHWARDGIVMKISKTKEYRKLRYWSSFLVWTDDS